MELKSSTLRLKVRALSTKKNQMSSPYAKAYVPVIVGVIMLILNQFGITETSTALDLVTAFVTAIGVWAVPNKTPIEG
jgi:hypothetical protein